MPLSGHLPVREVALERLCDWLGQMQEGIADDGTEGGDDAYDFDVNSVFRTPLENREQGTRDMLSIGVLEGAEVVDAGVGNKVRRLSVVIEWRSFNLATPDTAELYGGGQRVNNQILGNIQRRLKSNNTLATTFGGADGIIINLNERGSFLDTADSDQIDRSLEGAIQIEMVYKTDEIDVRRRLPGADFLADPSL